MDKQAHTNITSALADTNAQHHSIFKELFRGRKYEILWIPERMMAPFTLRGNQLRKMCLAVEEARPECKDERLFLLQK